MLNKICTDLETSKKLKELGIEMESNFYHYEYFDSDRVTIHYDGNYDKKYDVKAYTLEQILEMLPQYIGDNVLDDDKKDPCHFVMSKNILYYINAGCKYRDTMHLTTSKKTKDNLATTAARLLIKLKEDKII